MQVKRDPSIFQSGTRRNILAKLRVLGDIFFTVSVRYNNWQKMCSPLLITSQEGEGIVKQYGRWFRVFNFTSRHAPRMRQSATSERFEFFLHKAPPSHLLLFTTPLKNASGSRQMHGSQVKSLLRLRHPSSQFRSVFWRSLGQVMLLRPWWKINANEAACCFLAYHLMHAVIG